MYRSMRAAMQTAARWSAAGLGLTAGAYATCAAIAWLRYGHVSGRARTGTRDALLDHFMPVYEAGSRHHVHVAAPAAITLAAARDMDLLGSPVARALIRGRELILGATGDRRPRPAGLLAEVQALGWGVLAEIADREIVVGAVTQPWKADVVFRALPPDAFAGFDEPGYVKIVWTLRADPIDAQHSVFRTETRVVATDRTARAMFRRYWSVFSPGMALIRWASLAPLTREAERQARSAAAGR